MKLRHWIVLLALAAFVCAAPAWAAEAEAHGEGAHEQPGLMDLDLAAALTAIVTFLVLLFILTKLAWKPILNGLQQREETIRKAVDDAQKASDEARALAAEYKQKLDEATDQAKAIADEARRNAEAVRHRIEEDARQQAEATLARSVKEIERAKETAFDDLLKDVTTIASEAASRIIQKHLTPEDNAKLVDQVVEEFVAKGGGRGA